MKLKRPEMIAHRNHNDLEIETRAVDEFINHCDAIGYILATTRSLWRANRKIKRYFELTGAKLQGDGDYR